MSDVLTGPGAAASERGMGDKSYQQEPTMEEILASIRRIISENDEEAATARKKETEPRPEAGPADPQDGTEAQEPNEEVLDLTEVVDGEPGKAEAIDDPGEEASSAEPSPADDDSEDLEMRDAAVSWQDEDPPAIPLPAPDSPVIDAAPVPAQERDEEPSSPSPGPRARPGRDEPLLSEATDAAGTAALSALAQALDREPGATGNISLGQGNTLEDLVKDMIRPMLKEWLDRNLPTLVERLVRREIERMVRRAEDR